MDLLFSSEYNKRGLGPEAQRRLVLLRNLVLSAGFNVTAVKDPAEVEKVHFLDSLSVLDLKPVAGARSLVDVGSGAGFPALVLAIALPEMQVVAVEARGKKCEFIEKAASALGLDNLSVQWARAEEYGQGGGREKYDIAVSRALASLPVVAELSLPLVRVGGHMVAMKGAISNQERTQAAKAIAILGGGRLEAMHVKPFPDALHHWIYVAEKERETPAVYPRRAGIPAKRPLGSAKASLIRSCEGEPRA